MKSKAFRIIGLTVLGLIGVTVYLGMSLVQNLEEVRAAGDRFLGLLGEGRLEEAYQSTSTPFRQAETSQTFQEIVNRAGLREFVASSWTRRDMRSTFGAHGTQTLARLQGTVTLGVDSVSSMSMDLIYENGAWKVFNFSTKMVAM